MTVPFNSKCFLCASLSASKPSDKLNKAKHNRPVTNDQNTTKSYNFLLQISLWLRFLFHVPALENFSVVDCAGHEAAVLQKKSELERKEQTVLPWDSPSWFRWTGYKRSDQCSAQLGVRSIKSWNKWDSCRGVIYFSLWRYYRGQTHKGSAVVNTIQGSLNTLHQPLFYLFNYVHDMGKTHV